MLGFDPAVHRQSQPPRLQGVLDPPGRIEGRQQTRCQDVDVDSSVRAGSPATLQCSDRNQRIEDAPTLGDPGGFPPFISSGFGET